MDIIVEGLFSIQSSISYNKQIADVFYKVYFRERV